MSHVLTEQGRALVGRERFTAEGHLVESQAAAAPEIYATSAHAAEMTATALELGRRRPRWVYS